MNADLAAPAVPAGVSQRLVAVLENVAIARDTYWLRLDDPILARAILPGQFLMIRPAAEGADDSLLGQPFALYDVTTDAAGAPTAVDVVYLVVGRGTAALAQRRRQENSYRSGDRWVTVSAHRRPALSSLSPAALARRRSWPWAGGGWARYLMDCNRKVSIRPAPVRPSGSPHRPRRPCSMACALPRCWRGINDFRQVGIDVEIATDDGSAGHRGFVTELLARRLKQRERPARIVGCGLPPCSRPWRVWSNLSISPARSRSRTIWHAASERVSVRRPNPATRWHDRPPQRLR